MDLQAKLEQANKDKEAIEANIAEIEKENFAKTHRIGDRYMRWGGEEYIIAEFRDRAILVSIVNGRAYSKVSVPINCGAITDNDYNSLVYGNAWTFKKIEKKD